MPLHSSFPLSFLATNTSIWLEIILWATWSEMSAFCSARVRSASSSSASNIKPRFFFRNTGFWNFLTKPEHLDLYLASVLAACAFSLKCKNSAGYDCHTAFTLWQLEATHRTSRILPIRYNWVSTSFAHSPNSLCALGAMLFIVSRKILNWFTSVQLFTASPTESSNLWFKQCQINCWGKQAFSFAAINAVPLRPMVL